MVMKGEGLLICPQPRDNDLQQDSLEGLIHVLLFEDMVDQGLTSTQGNMEALKFVREAALASGAKVSRVFVSKVFIFPFHSKPKNVWLFI